MKAFGGRGIYDGSRFFPWGRGWGTVIEIGSSGVMGDAAGLEAKEVDGCGLVSCVAEGAGVEVKERGVIPDKNV